MVVIRLARGGAKKRPFYNLVVADSRDRRCATLALLLQIVPAASRRRDAMEEDP